MEPVDADTLGAPGPRKRCGVARMRAAFTRTLPPRVTLTLNERRGCLINRAGMRAVYRKWRVYPGFFPLWGILRQVWDVAISIIRQS